MDKDTFILLYKAMVIPHLEYANLYGVHIKRETLQALRKYKKEPQS